MMRRSHRSHRRRLARWLLRRALDGAARSAIVGDLDEEFSCFVAAAARRARGTTVVLAAGDGVDRGLPPRAGRV